MELSAIALRGLEDARNRVERSAERLARVGTTTAEGTPVNSVDLTREMVALLAARNDFAAGIRLLQTADELQRGLIDLLP